MCVFHAYKIFSSQLVFSLLKIYRKMIIGLLLEKDTLLVRQPCILEAPYMTRLSLPSDVDLSVMGSDNVCPMSQLSVL